MSLYKLLFEASLTSNWYSEESKIAEEFVNNIILSSDYTTLLDPDVIYNKETVLDVLSQYSNERFNLVKSKLKDLEGVDIEKLNLDDILDRVLGIDILFEFNGEFYCADVTTGGRSIVNNKANKYFKLENVLDILSIKRCMVIRVNKSLNIKLEEAIDELELLLNNWNTYKPTIYKKPHKKQPSGDLVRIIHI